MWVYFCIKYIYSLSWSTYHRASNPSWLNAILVDNESKLIIFLQSDVPFIDNHDYLLPKHKLSIPLVCRKPFRIRNFRGVDTAVLMNDVQKLSFAHVRRFANVPDPDSALFDFTNSVSSILDSYMLSFLMSILATPVSLGSINHILWKLRIATFFTKNSKKLTCKHIRYTV